MVLQQICLKTIILQQLLILTPQGQPGPIDLLDCYPMGSSALLLQWKPPQEVNGVLSGYRIYYSKVWRNCTHRISRAGGEMNPLKSWGYKQGCTIL